MHSVLNTFFQAPVSGEEKKKRLRERVAGQFLSPAIIFALSLELTSTKNGQPNAQRKKIRLSTSSQ
jgi:hypothetical protein